MQAQNSQKSVFRSKSASKGGGGKKTEIKTNKCWFWPNMHTYSIKTNIFCFFPKRPLKNLKNAHCWEKKQKEKLTFHYFRPTYIHTN